MVSNLHLIVLDVLDSNPQNVLSTVQSAIQNESDTELNKKSGTQSKWMKAYYIIVIGRVPRSLCMGL